jgi:surfeit locus 1 family protein
VAEAAARPRSPWVVLVAALVGIGITSAAGRWQYRKGATKEAQHQALLERSVLAPLPQQDLARSDEQAAAQHYRTVHLRGHWLAARTVYLDNRQMDGRPGFYIVTPLQLAAGDAVLVQRGWAPRDLRDRSLVPAVPTPEGEVELQGRVMPPPARLFDFGGVAGGTIRQNLDLAAYSREIGVPLRPLSIQQATGAGDGLQRRWPAPAADVQKHYGYAVQWFGMASLIAGLYLWFQLLKPRLRPSVPS